MSEAWLPQPQWWFLQAVFYSFFYQNRTFRSTTVSAHQVLNETNTRGKKRKEVVDAVAATIILESYLNYRRNNKEWWKAGSKFRLFAVLKKKIDERALF